MATTSRTDPPARGPLAAGLQAGERPRDATTAERVLERLWRALKEVEDPEIPVSVVDMGLIVSLAYDAPTRTARLQVTFTAMGCPAMEMIQEDIRERLLRDPEVASVVTEVVWDPVWTRQRLSEQARTTMRALGIAA